MERVLEVIHLNYLNSGVRGTVVNTFSNRLITRWNMLDQGAVDVTSVNAFKERLEKLRDTRIGIFMD